MSVANEAKAVYEADLREKLEAQYFGQFVAIEPESRDHFVAATFVDAALAAKAAHPNKIRGVGKGERVTHRSVVGSYSKTLASPIEKIFPVCADTTQGRSCSRGISAFCVHVFVPGSYSSTILSRLPLFPPIAYILPFSALTTPKYTRGVGRSAARDHISIIGS